MNREDLKTTIDFFIYLLDNNDFEALRRQLEILKTEI